MILELNKDGTFRFAGGTISWRLLCYGADGKMELYYYLEK